MAVTVVILAYRKPGISPAEFHRLYEAHMRIIQHLTGDYFPVSHKRTYVARFQYQPRRSNFSARNPTTPAIVYAGSQTDFDFDAIVELTFTDQQHFSAFMGKLSTPSAIRLVDTDEDKFMDRTKLCVVRMDTVCETKNALSFKFLGLTGTMWKHVLIAIVGYLFLCLLLFFWEEQVLKFLLGV